MSINSAPISLTNSIDTNESFNDASINQINDNISNKTRTKRKRSKLEDSLDTLAKLISNVTESYTTAIFVADQQAEVLHCLAHHTLSRDFSENVSIPYGKGLVGWTAENKVRITVCPFEHDSSTLLYYPSDQNLKSFIAVPIIGKNEELIGVIACDSKKNYAFAKITEKILTECAVQAQIIIDLHLDHQKLLEKTPKPTLYSDLDSLIEQLKNSKSEQHLFDLLCKTPQTIIAREAMIALVTSHEGYGEATFYSSASENRIEHHLVDLVCKHKKIICSERSVHVLPSDDIKARSFLSVPVNVYGKEAGALNVLSAAFKGFSPSDIEALERLAKCVGEELEKLRSKVLISSRQIGPSLLPWNHFVNQANHLLGLKAGAKDLTVLAKYSLLRIQLLNLFQLEQNLGVKNTAEVHEQILRFVQQLASQPMLASAPYGTSVYIMGEKSQVESLVKRLSSVISKIPYMENLNFTERLPENASELIAQNLELREIALSANINSISESISGNSYITQVEVKKPTAAQIPQSQNRNVTNQLSANDKFEKLAATSISPANMGINNLNAAKLKNSFDQRLSQALRSQENSASSDESSFVLGENNEVKEVANARFW